MIIKKLLFGICALVLFFNWAVFAGDPGVTDTKVVIGVTTPLTGPGAAWGIPISRGMKAWADHLNSIGGIHGRKIKLLIKDDGYNPARTMANLRSMKNKVFAVSGVLGSAPCSASKNFFPDNKIPLITAYGNVRIYSNQPKSKQRYYFIAYPDYEDENEYITNYAINELNSKKIAHFYQNDDYGTGCGQGIKKAIKANPGKAELVGSIPYEITERSLGTHALKLKEFGADTVILSPSMPHAALITKEMAKIGYNPKIITNFTIGDATMYKIAGSVWEGTYMTVSGHLGQIGIDPATKRVVDILLKENSSLKGKEYLAVFGAVSIMHLAKGMENAGSKLTRESLIEGMEKIKNWKPENMGAQVNYGPDRHHGVNAVRICRAIGGKHVPLNDYVVFKPRF